MQTPKQLENGILSNDLRCTFRIYKDDDKMVCITIGDKDVWQTGVRGRNIKQAIDRFHRIMSMAVAQCAKTKHVNSERAGDDDNTENLPRYLNEQQVSKITGRALQTLRNDRFCSKGLPYVKFGRSVRYSLADVVEFMESRKIVPAKLEYLND